MYKDGSEELNNIISNGNGKALVKRLVFTDDNTEITTFSTLKQYNSSASGELQIGTTNMSYIDVEVATEEYLTGREVRLECGAELEDGTTEYIPMGIFTIQKPEGDIDNVKFKANDRMQKTERLYSSSLEYPTTTDLIIEEICTLCGISLATPIENPITVTDKLEGYTCREVLGYVAGLHAKFACFDRLGLLNIRWYSETPIAKEIGLIWSFSKSQDDFMVSKLEVAKDSETKLVAGDGYGIVYNSNLLATQEIVNNLLIALNGFTYNASKVEMLDDVRLDVWDRILVTYLDGNEYVIPCMSLQQDYSNGSTIVEAFANSDTENEYRYTGPTTQYLNRLATELLVTNRVVASKVDAEYVQAHAITTDNLDAIEADIKDAVIQDLDAEFADIHLANIDIADIGIFFAESGLLKDVTIVDGHITGELDAVKINADMIKTGTLAVDRLLVTGADSIVYQINVNSSGLTQEELTDEVYQKYLNGTDIVANSITAKQLNVAKIFSDEAVLDTIFAQNITASGSITGVNLYGAHAEIDSGLIGGFTLDNGTLGYLEEEPYIDINTGEEVMSYYYSFGIKPTSYQDVFADTDKVMWFGAHPKIVGNGIDKNGYYTEEALDYSFYITADGAPRMYKGNIGAFEIINEKSLVGMFDAYHDQQGIVMKFEDNGHITSESGFNPAGMTAKVFSNSTETMESSYAADGITINDIANSFYLAFNKDGITTTRTVNETTKYNNPIQFSHDEQWAGNHLAGIEEILTLEADQIIINTLIGSLKVGNGLDVDNPSYFRDKVNISSTELSPLVIERENSDGHVAMGFENTDGILGYVGMSDKNDTLIMYSSSGTAMYAFVHSGNFANKVVDGLTSTEAGLALSANQGKVLNEKISTLEGHHYFHATNGQIGTVNLSIERYTSYILTLKHDGAGNYAIYLIINDHGNNMTIHPIIENANWTVTKGDLSVNITNNNMTRYSDYRLAVL